MKIGIIGSTAYQDRMKKLQLYLMSEKHEVQMPAFDGHPEWDELEICENNRKMIEWAEVVYIIWDQRSMGTVFDFGMCFALRKPIVIQYLEPKTFAGVMRRYAAKTSADFVTSCDLQPSQQPA